MRCLRVSTGTSARRGVVLLVFLLCLGSAGVAAQPAAGASRSIPDVDAALAQADVLLGKSQFKDAAVILIGLRAASGLTPQQRAIVLERLASTQVELSQLEEALRSADEAAAAARLASADVVLRQLEIVRGSAWRFRGFMYRGVGHYEAALALAERAGDHTLESTALSLLSSVYKDLGDWNRVLDYAERAFRAQPKPSAGTRFRYLVQRGIAYFEFDDRARAHEAFQGALAVAREAGNRRAECLALGELGLVAWEFDRDYPRALDLFDRALAIARESGVPGLEVTWLNNSGGALRDAGRLEESLHTYRQALALEERIGQQGERPYLLKNIGQVLSLLGRPNEAERFLLEALQLADAQNVPKIRWMARMELGEVYRARNPARADRYFVESLQVLEGSRGTVLMERLRAGVLGRALARFDVFDRYIQFLLERGEEHKAFAIAERARARIFLETLGTARAELAKAIPPDYGEREGALLSQISALQSRLRAPDLRAADRRTLLTDIDQAEDTLASLRVRLAVERPALAQLRFPQVWEADEVRTRLLAPDETIAMFFLGQRRSACWIVAPGGLTLVRLPPRDAIESAVRRLLPTLQSPAARVDEEARAWLSSTLIAPIAAKVPAGTHLIVVPHAILHYLPFEMLAHPAGGHLVEHVTVSYAPSVSSLAYLRQLERPRPRPATLLAIGGPSLGSQGAADSRGTPLAWIGELKPLPYARTEIRRIAAQFSPTSRVLEARAATEDALRSASLRHIGILHLATHALIDEDHPERSALALARGAGASDGVLQAREVYNLDLDATLVTLSACQTALGRQVTGEGIVGLSRAFFYAGAGAVTASLWNVSDRATADLMTSFYRRLRSGQQIDRALTEAKREFLAGDAARRHPYFWAPFVVAGHARTALPPQPAEPASAFPTALTVVAGATGLASLAYCLVVLSSARRSKRRAPAVSVAGT